MNWKYKLSKRLSLLKSTIAAVMALSACGSDQGVVGPALQDSSEAADLRFEWTPVASVTVAPTSHSMLAGATTQLTGTARSASGTILNRTFTWTTSNSAVATVTSKGRVTALAAGTATITARYGSKSGSSAITVTAPVAPVASIQLQLASSQMVVGGTVQVTAIPKDSAGTVLTGRPVAWASLNTAIVTVSQAGLVTAVGIGSIQITATSGNAAAAATLHVSATPPVTPPSTATVTVTPATASLLTGGTVLLTATPWDSAGNALAGRTITWSTSAGSIASVSAGGLATAVMAGSATITATVDGKSAGAALTITTPVLPPPTGYQTPDILNNASFEAGFDGFRDGSGQTPSGVTRDLSQHADGSYGVRRSVARSGWTILSFTAASPTVVYAPGANLNDGQRIGLYTSDAGMSADYYSNNGAGSRWAKRIDADHFAVYSNSALTTPVSSAGGTGGSVTTADMGPTFAKWDPNYAWDRISVRFYFYFDAVPDRPFKFQIFEGQSFNGQFGGLYVMPTGRLEWLFANESSSLTGLASMSSLVNGWHYVEVDYWRNGDVSGGGDYPSVAIWLDGVPITSQLGGLPSGHRWINGRLNAGSRGGSVSQKIGTVNMLGIVNRGNTVAANVWVDRVSVSTRGRIGP